MKQTTKKIKREGSGRTKGSFSFVKISLKDLKAKFADETTLVVVSRKYAETVGFQNLTSTSATDTFNSIQGTEAVAPVDVKLKNLSTEDETETTDEQN